MNAQIILVFTHFQNNILKIYDIGDYSILKTSDRATTVAGKLFESIDSE